MRNETVKDYKVISNSNLSYFEEEVKSFLEAHKDAISIQVNSSSTLEGHFAHIYWEERKLVAEDIRDEFILRDEKYRCENCPHYGGNSDNPRHAFSCLRKVFHRRRGCDEACLFFYQELAKGDLRPYESRGMV